MADTRQHAAKAFDVFLEKYRAKYPVACECLAKDRDVLLAFYDFPAEHWKHLRTTNPIESTFATIRLRQRRTKGCGSRRASLTMMFKLAQAAQKRWRRLNGHQHIVHLLEGKTVRQRSHAGRRLENLKTRLSTIARTTARNVVAMNRLRRLKRYFRRDKGAKPSAPAISTANQ